jgi:hypothetical protein
MAQVKKESHDQVVNNLAAVIEAQMEAWASLERYVQTGLDGPRTPETERLLVRLRPRALPGAEPQKAAGYVRPELERLVSAPESETGLRAAFLTWLQGTDWRCETCAQRVDSSTLKVPPPIDGSFHMYCAEHG